METPAISHVTPLQSPLYRTTDDEKDCHDAFVKDEQYISSKRSNSWRCFKSADFIRVIIMAIFLTVLTVLASIYSVSGRPHPKSQISKWDLEKLTSVVTFGDSYTDESQAWYINEHGGSGPPPGWTAPLNPHTASGGYVWPRYVNWYSGANTYNYAVSGAVCSRAITAHKGVGIQEYEIPTFLADKAYKQNGKSFLNIPANETVYSIWIGTNDLGWYAFLTHDEEPGKTLTDYVDCVFKTFDQIYAAGGRYLILMNNIPLELAPMYADAAHGGVNWTHFWPERPKNVTQVSLQMAQNVLFTNSLFKSRIENISKQGTRYADAQIALFDTWKLFRDMYDHPKKYLNGTAPLDVQKPAMQCFQDGGCATSRDPDSYIWWDDLHPSEQADRVVAREFLNVVAGNSSFATYYS